MFFKKKKVSPRNVTKIGKKKRMLKNVSVANVSYGTLPKQGGKVPYN